MPHFYFHVHDGESYPDLEGTELSDLSAARNEAVRLAGSLLTREAAKFWDSGDWRLRVTDDQDMTLFQLTFFATDAGAVIPKKKDR